MLKFNNPLTFVTFLPLLSQTVYWMVFPYDTLQSEIWLVPKSNNIAAGVYKMLPEAGHSYQTTYKTPFSINFPVIDHN